MVTKYLFSFIEEKRVSTTICSSVLRPQLNSLIFLLGKRN